MNRRAFLGGVTAAATATVAGCQRDQTSQDAGEKQVGDGEGEIERVAYPDDDVVCYIADGNKEGEIGVSCQQVEDPAPTHGNQSEANQGGAD